MNSVRWVILFLGLFSSISAQCDLSIIDVDLNTYDVTVAVGEGEGCTVSMLQIGFHIPNNEQPLSIGPCVMNPDNFHPGWWYGALAMVPSSWADLPITNGDTIVMPLDNAFAADCSPGEPESNSLGCCAAPFLDYYLEQGECIEFVIWQINFSPTWYTADGGWATGTEDGVSPFIDEYPDMNCNNSWYTCRENNPGGAVGSYLCSDTLCTPQYIIDTVYVTLIDTLIEYVEVSVIDTIEIFSTDTVTQYDTTYVYDYIYLYDTLIEYSIDTLYVTHIETVYTTILLDCDTEEPCDYEVLDPGCRVYIPNSVTPNNDGHNDGWGAVTAEDCWFAWSLSVYNRWGECVWVSNIPDEVWAVGYHEYYVPDGMYTWALSGSTYSFDHIDKAGTITVIR